MASRNYDFTLSAAVGATQRIDVMGCRVKVISATAQVEVRTENGDVYQLLAGQGFSLPKNARGEQINFREVVIKNLTAAANTGVVFIGDEYFEDSRITGDVTVIDNGASKTINGGQFLGVAQQNGSAGVFSVIALQSSTKRVAVKRAIITSATTGFVLIGRATGVPAVNPQAYGGVLNKLLGGPVSSFSRFGGTIAAATPTNPELPGWADTIYWPVTVGVPFELPITTPIIIPINSVWWAQGANFNSTISLTLDFEEL